MQVDCLHPSVDPSPAITNVLTTPPTVDDAKLLLSYYPQLPSLQLTTQPTLLKGHSTGIAN